MIESQLRALRRHHGLTQTQVAAAVGLAQSDVSDAEAGKRGPDTVTRVFEGILRSTGPERALRRHGAEMRAYLDSVGASNPCVFGSTARGESRWNSDLDIAATFPPSTSFFDVLRWEQRLRRIAGGVRVELVSRAAARDALARELERDAVPL